MFKNEAEIKLIVVAIVEALYENGMTDQGSDYTDVAESTFYLALGMDIWKWEKISGLMLRSDLIQIRSHRVRLTAKGVKLAQDCIAIRKGEPAAV